MTDGVVGKRGDPAALRARFLAGPRVRGMPLDRRELHAVAGLARELAPQAEMARVVLGFEDVIPAAGDLRILDQVGSAALQVYYDIGNEANLGGWTPAGQGAMKVPASAETLGGILKRDAGGARWPGKSRARQFRPV